ncbi:MAG: hypothetical protein FJ096_22280 [Deltaproteobacteria bacterium]|nr:hypothetical protein [Deltaproteobacteria bacterium]
MRICVPSKSRLSLAAFLLVAGCGHPATREDCELIFDRTAELALRSTKVTEPAEVARAVAEARADKGEAMMKQCLGKRITDEVLACVRAASSADALDRCLQ